MKNLIFFLLLFTVVLGCNKAFVDDSEVLEANREQPQLLNINKTLGNAGDTITLTGRNLSDITTVNFADNPGAILEKSESILKVVVPTGAGSVFVRAQRGLAISNEIPFTYIAPPSPVAELSVSGVKYEVDTLAYFTAGPGTTYMELQLWDTARAFPLKVYVTKIDGTNPYVKLKPVLARDSAINTESVPSMATRKSTADNLYFAGINANYFKTTPAAEVGRLTHAHMIDRVMTSINYLNYFTGYRTAAFVNNRITFDSLRFYAYAMRPDGVSKAFTVVNDGRADSYLVLYNPYNGKITRTNQYGPEYAVVPVSGSWGDYRDVQTKVTAIRRTGSTAAMPIPQNGAVLSGHNLRSFAGEWFLKSLQLDDIVTVSNFATDSRGNQVDQIVSGDRFVLENGIIGALLVDNNRHARTSIGGSADGNTTYFCVVDGNQPGVSVGVSTTGLGEIMKMIGAYNAINLSGAQTSTMYLFNGRNEGLMNIPNGVSTAPAVANGMYAVSSAPADNNVTQLVSASYTTRLSADSTFTPEFYGLNQYGIIVNNSPAVSLSAPAELGTVMGTSFKAGTAGNSGVITATYNGITTSIKVFVK